MHELALISLLVCALAGTALAAGSVSVEKTKYSTYGNCYKLSNGTVDVMVTLDLGPRVIYYGFTGGENTFAELSPDAAVKHELGEWHPWGGHRLWHAPEVLPRSYVPDNDPVTAELVGKDSVRVAPALENATSIQKEMLIALAPDGTEVTITHKLTNKGQWAIELAPWALTIVNGGGVTIFPQEPFVSHEDSLLPARPLALWSFTDMSDPRWKFGKQYIRLRTDSDLHFPQKIGAAVKAGWGAYLRKDVLFVKRFPYIEGAKYPDFGCNFETYTDGDFMEVETLAPLTKLEPGASATHVEHWYLFKGVNAGDTEDSLDKALAPLIAQTK